MHGHGILSVQDLNSGTVLKQGDKTLLKFKLVDYDSDELNIVGKPVEVVLMTTNFKEKLTIANTTVGSDGLVSLSISIDLLPNEYYMEFIVNNKYIFPSEHRYFWRITPSSKGSDLNIISMVGVDELIDRIVPKVEKASADEVANLVKPRVTPRIDSDGTWIIGGEDTGFQARGPKGDKGDPLEYKDLTEEQILELRGEPTDLSPYLTEEQSDFKYQPKGNYTTVVQAESKYQPLGNYLSKNEQIGGRNLLKNSYLNKPIASTGDTYEINDYKGTKPIAYSYKDCPFFTKGVYTLSFEAKIGENNPETSSIRLSTIKNGSASTIKYIGRSQFSIEWKKVSYTFTLSEDIGIGLQAYTHAFGSKFATYVAFRNFKIEKGSIATDWTPAPEDMVSKNGKDFKQSMTVKNLIKNITGNTIGTVEKSGQEYTIAINNLDSYPSFRMESETYWNPNHKYYFSLNGLFKYNSVTSISFRGYGEQSKLSIIANIMTNYSVVITPTTEGSGPILLRHRTSDSGTYQIGDVIKIKEPIVIDLTSTFGAGNEPTKEQLDAYIANGVIDWANNDIRIGANVTIYEKIKFLEQAIASLSNPI
ncbi:hypothetical protein [Facklamia miroungae]|uniref:Uncharacterized protein n=1 Tax=Facklamia miroungae TaxID=120956 RepID=A0A1G7P0S1_9LACT|nr:hypothetical protein [Facklamia miroungae]NKZ28542.1 hypothetical protein [Facklamia miroungae]SDF79912.1 hypothetical protein SAMN05421791_10183 [Facklamia miroungae]